MYGFMLNIVALTVFIIAPILTVILVVRTAKKKPVKRIYQALGITALCFVCAVIGAIFNVPKDMVSEMPTTTEKVETTAKIQEPTTEKPASVPTTEKVDTMIQQFIQLGFTQTEAEEMKKIFATVGITEIHNIRYAIGSGVDSLQSFTCDIYDYHADRGGVSLHFTIDKRQLCFISLNGIPTTKTDYAYINIFGNVKFKTSNAKKSVTLYDIWDEDGEIDSNAIGYKAVFDYENEKITNYEE